MLAAVQFPILGVDFLRANSLIVDAAVGRLIHSKSLRQIPAAEGAVGDGGLYAAVCATPPAYRDLFAEFQLVLISSGELPLLHTVYYTSWRLQGRPSPPNFGGWTPPS